MLNTGNIQSKVYFNAVHKGYTEKIKDKTSKLNNYTRSLLTSRAYGLTVAMATIKAGLAVLCGNDLHGGSICL